MLASLQWINRYLDPSDVTADEAEHVLTHVGFPIEEREDLAGGDTRMDVELTSNRGDCLCHLGLAREIAAATQRLLVEPRFSLSTSGEQASSVTSVDNTVPDVCPRFTARVITGVRVGPSPDWLRRALESIGQHPINNVVDASNYVLHEIGHPNHVFDMARLAERRLIVRRAKSGERVTALDGHEHKLIGSDLVVADAERAVSLAGVIGGLDTGVTEETTDVLLEVATWDPVTVRTTARRLGISTDACYRFERFVDPRDLAWASERCAALIAELTGGTVLPGMIDEGSAPKPRTAVDLRLSRCSGLIGIDIDPTEARRLLDRVGIEVSQDDDRVIRCAVPHHRHDITREVDLIEELARLKGFDAIEIAPSLDVHMELGHPEVWSHREQAMDRLAEALTGFGFYETVTFSFVSEEHARPFVRPGHRLLKVDEKRRPGSPFLRPSLISSLLTCRKANQDARVSIEGGVRLYEVASAYSEIDDGEKFDRRTVEQTTLAMLIDAPGGIEGRQSAIRTLRGAIEAVAHGLAGEGPRLEVVPSEAASRPAYEGLKSARVLLAGEDIGEVVEVEGALRRAWDLDEPVMIAELLVEPFIARYPPQRSARALPSFPPIDRDLSLIVDESVAWRRIEESIASRPIEQFEDLAFVGVYRGKQIGPGKKSVTLRLRFRDPARTLRHEEVDPQIADLVELLKSSVGAELRT